MLEYSIKLDSIVELPVVSMLNSTEISLFKVYSICWNYKHKLIGIVRDTFFEQMHCEVYPGPCCFIDKEILPTLLSTGWFQEWIGMILVRRNLLSSQSNYSRYIIEFTKRTPDVIVKLNQLVHI